MSTIQLPPLRPISDDVRDELRKLEEYGRHYSIRRWSQRTAGEQDKIECALSAFRSFRLNRGEDLDGDIWDMAPPDVATVQIYVGYLRHSSRPWRDASVAALRLYLLHIEDPDLFRMVEAPLVRAH